MSNLSNTSGSSSKGFSYSEDSNSRIFDKINEANKSSLAEIFKHYNLNISSFNKKVCCPFSRKHSKGIDSVPSFVYYPDSNSFWCFACKTGNKACNFVAAIENISIYEAATIIIHQSFDIDNVDVPNYYPQIHLEFSTLIRNAINNNPDDYLLIEDVCKTFDIFNKKYPDLNEKTQLLFLNKLKNKLEKKLIG